MLKPSDNGEGTKIEPPSEQEELALDAGISPADILLPTTNRVIDIKGNF